MGSPSITQRPPCCRSAALFASWPAASASFTSASRAASATGFPPCSISPAGSYPVPLSSTRPLAVTTARTVISLRVRVPVLSEQMMVVEPSVSTEESRRTMTFRAAMRRVPSDRTTVVMAVSPSGTAATARDTARRSTSTRSPRARRCSTSTSVTAIATAMAMTAAPSSFPTRSSSFCSGVAPSPVARSEAAILPSSVRSPVPVTTARPRPEATAVPLHTMLVWSPRPASDSIGPVPFTTAALSPVSADSAVRSAIASTTRASAAMESPSSSARRSPTTSAAVGTVRCSPSRITRAAGIDMASSAESACSARRSCTKPSTPFTRTMARMVSAS